MSAKLKLAYTESNIESLAMDLSQDNAQAKIKALACIDCESINQLLELVKLCAYDFRPEVRAQAYRTLKLASQQNITSVIKDAVRDMDKNAFKAARELMHSTI